MCKTSLQADGTSNWGVNEFVEQSIKRLFPLDLLERQNGFEEDQMNEANVPSENSSKAVYNQRKLITMIILQFLFAPPASPRYRVLCMCPSQDTG